MKMKPIVIFGTGDIAQLAWFYFTHDSPHEVVGFTVDRAFLDKETFCGLPVFAFEDAPDRWPSSEFDMFVALSYSSLNRLRREKCDAARAKGYALVSYISSKATVWPGFQHGENCFILEDNTLQPFAVVGNNVTLWSGNHIGHHSRIGDDCFIASHVVISGGVEIGNSCFIGVNATFRDHIKIGERCVIGAGCLITGDAEAEGVYIGTASERAKVPSSRLRRI
jgi:sugar O-acyltransferase (sialic acid O-acetyltransferase NeuD family)